MSTVHTREYQAFLEKLKRARLEAGLTQAQAARCLGKPQSFISKSESGERRLDFVELRRLGRIYRKKLSYFEPR